MTLTLKETQIKLTKVNFDELPKPRKNKGVRGQLLELALGIPNSSKLTDMVDGELKSFTKGESIAVTQLRHVLPEIIGHDFKLFKDSKVGIKLRNTLFVSFDRDNNYLGSTTLNAETHPEIYDMIEEDFEFIGEEIQSRWLDDKELSTITGLNGLLQIRTKDSKPYSPIYYEDVKLSNKGYAFYLTGKFGRNITVS